MKRDELLAHNKTFIKLATDLMHVLRQTDDGSCAVCGVPQGTQHRAGFICRALVEWRSSARYGGADNAG